VGADKGEWEGTGRGGRSEGKGRKAIK